jgi:hypothetical protein
MCPLPSAGTLAAMNTRSRVLAVGTVAGAALLAAACGGSSTSPASTSAAASSPSGVAFAQCMRTHGIPDYPAPQSNGQMQKIASGQQVGVSDSVLKSAETACQALWPYQGLTQAQGRQELADAVMFAQCMRAHGLPKFPDPSTDPASGRAEFVISVSRDGFNPQSPQVLAKARTCEQGLPASVLPGSPDGVEETTTP